MLKNVDGEWVRNKENLKEMMRNFFSNLYMLVGFRNFQHILSQIPTSIDAPMNQKLTKPVTMEEIIVATHQLGATKAPRLGLNGLFF